MGRRSIEVLFELIEIGKAYTMMRGLREYMMDARKKLSSGLKDNTVVVEIIREVLPSKESVELCFLLFLISYMRAIKHAYHNILEIIKINIIKNIINSFSLKKIYFYDSS